MLDDQTLTDIFFELLALYQLFGADIKHEGAVWRTEHTVNLIDSDVAVLGSLLGGEGQLGVMGTLSILLFSMVLTPFINQKM